MNLSQTQNTQAAPVIEIVALCGSLNPNSATRRALQIALRGAQNSGAHTTLVDFNEWKLPFAGSNFAPEEWPDVARLSQLLQKSHGQVWGTPEYHGSFSGLLKNALDLMSFPEFSGKMVGLVGVADGSIGAINALAHLRGVGRQLHAWVLPSQASVASAYRAFGENGDLNDAKNQQRLLDLGRDLTRFAYLHSLADDAFLKQWEAALPGETA